MKQSCLPFILVLLGLVSSLAVEKAAAQVSPVQESTSLSLKVQTVRQTVLASHANLQREESILLQQLDELKSGRQSFSPESRKDIHERWVAHEKEVKAEAVKIDPSVGPYL